MKNIRFILLCLVLVLSCVLAFAACNKDTTTDESTNETKAAVEDTASDETATEPAAQESENSSEEATEAPSAADSADSAAPADSADDSAAVSEPTDSGDDSAEPADSDNGDNAESSEPEEDIYYDPEYYIVISSPEDLMNFNQKVNEVDEFGYCVNDYYEMTVVFTADIDMTGYDWVPLNGQAIACVTFDGNGHTISNLEILHEPAQGTPADQMGAGFVGVANDDLYFQNINFDSCHVTAYERAVGNLIGCVIGGYMSFENVNVTNFVVDGWMDYADQDRENGGHPISFRSAGFIGHIMAASSSADFLNCHVDKIKLSGFHNLAGFIGYASDAVDEYCFENCSVSNAEFTFSYCMSDSYTVDMPKKYVSVFYNAANWADNVQYVVDNGNTYSSVSYFDWTDDNKEYTAGEFLSWSREEAAAAA